MVLRPHYFRLCLAIVRALVVDAVLVEMHRVHCYIDRLPIVDLMLRNCSNSADRWNRNAM